MQLPVLQLTPTSPSWPRALDNIDAPPAALWALGQTHWLSRRPVVALVGTRSPTVYGLAQAARFARELTRAGVLIVSGLARGVDAAAHASALDAGGGTIAVLGCGVDRPWPAGPLAERVARHGLLLSEYRPGTAPRRHHFPRRNRLISGLADAVVVIEAAWASGSLITARWAADQGRTVCALPGRVDHPLARGTHRLLREGATLVESPDEVLAELGLVAAAGPEGPTGPAGPRDSPRPAQRAVPHGAAEACAAPRGTAAPHEDPWLAALHAALEGETLTADELAERTAHEVGEVLTGLVLLELAGFVARGPGGLYHRI